MNNKYYDLITKWEHDKLTEEQIVNKLLQFILNDMDNPDLRFDINDALNWKGYTYQFDNIYYEKEEFDPLEYSSLVTNITKSKASKTEDLIYYLRDMDDFRLTLSALPFIKLSKYDEISVLKLNNKYFDNFKDDNFYNLYMSFFTEEGEKYPELKEYIDYILDNMGLSYVDLDYMVFRMYMEYLLSTISNNPKIKNGYLIANSIKVAFDICPKEYLTINGKEYFNKNIHKSLVKYLSLIDKKEIKRIKEKYQDSIDYLDDTGYKLLFNML